MRYNAKLLKSVFGANKVKSMSKGKSNIDDLAKPKDKWKRGKKLLEL